MCEPVPKNVLMFLERPIVSGTETVIPNLLVPITTLKHYMTAIISPTVRNLKLKNLQTLAIALPTMHHLTHKL